MLNIVQKTLEYSSLLQTLPVAAKHFRDAHFGLKRLTPLWNELGDPLYGLVQSVRMQATAIATLPADLQADAKAALAANRSILERYAQCLPPEN